MCNVLYVTTYGQVAFQRQPLQSLTVKKNTADPFLTKAIYSEFNFIVGKRGVHPVYVVFVLILSLEVHVQGKKTKDQMRLV